MTHLNEQDLILHHYGESQQTGDFAQHIASCPSCQSRMEDLKKVLALMDAVEIPERDTAYGAAVWEKLRHRLPERRHWLGSFLMHPPRWVLAGSTAVLIVGAFLLGRLGREPASPPVAPQAVSEQARVRILLASVEEHLERSQLLLMEIVHKPLAESIDLSQQRVWAVDLVDSNRLYRQTAERAGETAMAGVLDDLERVLMEIAHVPETMTSADLARIQECIDSQGILFKVRVIGAQVRERERSAARALARRTS